MEITNVNKRFTSFPTMIKHEKHLDDRAKISENSDEFLHSLVNGFKIKFLHPMKKVHGNAINQNGKPQRAEKYP